MTSVCPMATNPSTLIPVRMSRMLPALKKLRPVVATSTAPTMRTSTSAM